MFNRLAKNNKNKPFLVNTQPNHKFADLASIPETQLVMLVPRDLWPRLPAYIEAYESVSLAGRFGADPGEFEWEWVPNPEGVRWWRRGLTGAEALFGMAVAVSRPAGVELYGLVELDENSPHWAEVIPAEAANAMPGQARVAARQTARPEHEILYELYRDYFRSKGMLSLDQAGQPALRRGTVREVERFRDAITNLLDRASKAKLPVDNR